MFPNRKPFFIMYKIFFNQPLVKILSWLLLVMSVAGLIICFHQVSVLQNPLITKRWFTQQILTETYHLNDLGVADVNDDHWLDVFTTNHSVKQSLLINEDSGGFTDQLLPFGLSQSNDFPGIGPADSEPAIKSSGLYIYWHKSELIVRTHDLEKSQTITGEIELADWVVPDSVVLTTKGALQASSALNTAADGSERLTIRFSGQDESQLIVRSRQYEIVDSVFNLESQIPLEQIYIGAEYLHPSSHEFAIKPGKDRHGLAWGDYNADQQIDVFIARGGGSGTLTKNSVEDKDELLIQNNGALRDQTVAAGILKNACPGRQVAPIDFDRNGQLDIYLVCGRNKPPRQNVPNQLHQQSEGNFVDVATDVGLDIPEKGSFVWLDADIDGDMDLFWAGDNNEFWLYVNQGQTFVPQLIGQNRGRIKQLTLADYDADGDFDIFAAAVDKSILLNNHNGIFRMTEPQSVGLPVKAYAANWIDYDNDGLMDLHLMPNGIYRQRPDHHFEKTHLLEMKSFKRRNHDKIFCTWFDSNNDGTRDLLVAIEDRPYAWLPGKLDQLRESILPQDRIFRLSKWRLSLYPNRDMTNNHWLQLQLIGREGNRQAIGARVEVSTPDGTQLAQVGQAEGSIFSQGHYRLYFGLGRYKDADAVRIFWPDGSLQEIKVVEGNQLLRVEYPAPDEPYGISQESSLKDA